ncbi:hypothetical protein [Microvirga alba]|uniref:Uncharacterized protein n=1 Tax=Microvirga alba TaxID=2791025 RepID=A0A931BRE7_9HYPH|nr:hypothetical protein [Microvirga alba]MBF9235541.1 hypothetical protein [Microvirga alba]
MPRWVVILLLVAAGLLGILLLALAAGLALVLIPVAVAITIVGRWRFRRESRKGFGGNPSIIEVDYHTVDPAQKSEGQGRHR